MGREGLGLPFQTAIAPTKHACWERSRRHNKLADWARQLVLQAHRWLPGRDLGLVGDSGFATLKLLDTLCYQDIVCITRLRLDAEL